MKRYQLYLNQHSVSVVDAASEIVEMSRSKIIQNVIDRISQEIIDIATVKKHLEKNNMQFLINTQALLMKVLEKNIIILKQ